MTHLKLGFMLFALTAIQAPKLYADEKHADKAHMAPTAAVAVMAATKGNKVEGTLMLKQFEGYVEITGTVSGLTLGKHGFHVHEFGDLRDPEGKSAGGHYNPTGAPHAGPHDAHRHAGDLGNIDADDKGVATVKIKAEGLEVHHVLGRSLVVHAGPDDLKSQPAGDSGPRVAVGVIGVQMPDAK